MFSGFEHPATREKFEKEVDVLIRVYQFVGQGCTKDKKGKWVCYIVRKMAKHYVDAWNAAEREGSLYKLQHDAKIFYKNTYGVDVQQYVRWPIRDNMLC